MPGMTGAGLACQRARCKFPCHADVDCAGEAAYELGECFLWPAVCLCKVGLGSGSGQGVEGER